MKFPLFRSLVLAGALVVAWNCSDTPMINVNDNPEAYETVKSLDMGGGNIIYIRDNNEVIDINGNIIGTYDPTTLEIKNTQGEVIIGEINKDDLPDTPIEINSESGSSTSEQPVQPGYSSGNQPTSSNGQPIQPVTSSNSQPVQPTSSASQPVQPPAEEGKCYDKASNKNVPYYENLKGGNEEQYAYNEKCEFQCYYDPAGKDCADVKNGNNQPGPQQKSSSSQQQPQPKSSSSQQPWQPTYSSSSNGGTSTGCPKIVTKGGGGSGWATRYWDGCKPSCSWTGNAGGKLARQCTSESKGKQTSSNWDAGSVCDGGGNMMACTSQIPFTVNGCSEMAFAFAAVPASNGGQCGKCFQLTFTGEGNWETTANHQALRGKKLIIMVTNVGHDVQQGQFDIMIPGGGPGAFNATSKYGWSGQGEQYGGLLSNCESESGWDGDFASKRKTCLENKCKNAFGGDSEAIQGCLFLATWMNAAGNPKHNYEEVECPAVLSDKY